MQFSHFSTVFQLLAGFSAVFTGVETTQFVFTDKLVKRLYPKMDADNKKVTELVSNVHEQINQLQKQNPTAKAHTDDITAEINSLHDEFHSLIKEKRLYYYDDQHEQRFGIMLGSSFSLFCALFYFSILMIIGIEICDGIQWAWFSVVGNFLSVLFFCLLFALVIHKRSDTMVGFFRRFGLRYASVLFTAMALFSIALYKLDISFVPTVNWVIFVCSLFVYLLPFIILSYRYSSYLPHKNESFNLEGEKFSAKLEAVKDKFVDYFAGQIP